VRRRWTSLPRYQSHTSKVKGWKHSLMKFITSLLVVNITILAASLKHSKVQWSKYSIIYRVCSMSLTWYLGIADGWLDVLLRLAAARSFWTESSEAGISLIKRASRQCALCSHYWRHWCSCATNHTILGEDQYIFLITSLAKMISIHQSPVL
jgi:hypothetical protein